MLVCVDTIYADSLLALNLAADYLLLLAAGRISGTVTVGTDGWAEFCVGDGSVSVWVFENAWKTLCIET